MINHRYRVGALLGSGGSGDVYVADDTLNNDQRVALKILHAQATPAAADEQAFWAEVSVLTKLLHPNIIRMFDFGRISSASKTNFVGRRFFTMEMVEGSDLGVWYKTVSSSPKRQVVLTAVLMQVLSALHYIHRAGIIHFDIKPENLLILNQMEQGIPSVKIMDFGFAGTHTAEQSVRGTLQYTAPELLRGEQINGRADLYSLGATLFELLEGRNVFDETEPVALIKSIINDEPAFPETMPSDLSSFYHLIRLLLSKEPEKRPDSARAAANVICSNTSDDFRRFFRTWEQPAFVGRKSELDFIVKATEALARRSQSAPTSLLIAGPEGIGKSALLVELIKSAGAYELRTMNSRGRDGDPPLATARRVVRFLQAEARSFSADGMLLAEAMEVVFSRVDADMIGGGNATDHTRRLESTIEACARFIIDCSALLPLILTFDDIQFVDEASLSVIATVIRDATPGRMLIVATTSQTSTPATVPWSKAVELEEFDVHQIQEMCRSVLEDKHHAAAIGTHLHSQYGGTPGIIVEAIKSVNEQWPESVPDDDIAGTIAGILPKDLDGLLHTRFAQLRAEERLVLSALSCFHLPAPHNALFAILPFNPERSERILALLEAKGYVVIVPDTGHSAIRQSRLKSVISAAIREDALDLHAMIGATIESSTPLGFAELQEIALQYLDCGNTGKAQRFFLEAANAGADLTAYKQSVQLYEMAATCARSNNDAPGLRTILARLADALYKSREFQRTIDIVNEILPEATPETKSLLHKNLGLAQIQLGQYRQAKENIGLALDNEPGVLKQLQLRQELVGIEVALGNYPAAEVSCLGQLDEALKHNDGHLLGSIYTDLGITAFAQDRLNEAVGYFTESTRVYEGMGEQLRLADAMINTGNALSAQGKFSEAIDHWDKALGTSKGFGTLNQQSQIYNNLGIAHYKLREYGKARELYLNALEIARRINSTRGIAYALTNLGEVALVEGAYETSLTTWKEARELYATMEDAHGLVETLLQLVQVDLIFGHTHEIADALGKAQTLIDANGLDTFMLQYLQLRGQYLLLCEKPDQAITSLEEAVILFRSNGSPGTTNPVALLAEARFRSNAGNAHDDLARIIAAPLTNPREYAEACYIMGIIGQSGRVEMAEKPLTILKKGLDAIRKEPVSELSWKLPYALGAEYLARGQHDRATEFLKKAGAVLRYFIAQCSSPELRNHYLRTGQRQEILDTIKKLTS
ncbi:MAG: serine/threonine-protein kinase PknK [Bacteroidota bacterium]